jgi:1-acyl-sn-glycerol-3-phosphate acyltransferase
MISDPARRILHDALYGPVALLATLGFSMRVEGSGHVPKKGGFIIVCNHQSALDPAMIALAVGREVRYLARTTLFSPKPFGWFIEAFGAMRLNHTMSGTEGLKMGLDMIKRGYGVVIYPEGRRTPDGPVYPFKPGVIILIRRGQVPVLPMAVAGAFECLPIHRWFPRPSPMFLAPLPGTLSCVIGKPIPHITLTSMSNEAILSTLHQEVVKLRARAEKIRRKPE